MYEIVTTPHPILLRKADEVKKIDKKIHEIIKRMSATLDSTTDPKGIGLAATQVGIPYRMFLVKPSDQAKISAFINPVIEHISDGKTVGGKSRSKRSLLEGCLSIPTIWGKVKRKKEVVVSYQDEHGGHHKQTFKGFMSIIIQHELDHLNGVLFTKHVLDQGEKLYKSRKNDKGEEEFEEINF